MKRYLYIIIGIVVAAVIAISILLFIKYRSNVTPSTTNSTGFLPAATNGEQINTTSTAETFILDSNGTTTANQPAVKNFGILSANPVLDYFVNSQNGITTIQPNGTIAAIINGQFSIVNSSTIDNIISVGFSSDGKKILVSFGDPTNPRANLFDIKTNTWTQLPSGMLSPQWAPTGYQIAYLSNLASGKIALSIINAVNLKSGIATVLTLHANDLNLQWPAKFQFILSDRPSIDNNGSMLLFNSQAGSLTPIISERAGLESIWSQGASSSYGLAFIAGQRGQNSLFLETLSISITQQLLSFLTLPSKCTFDGQQLYCGIPRSSSNFSSANLPDDYNMMALFTSDDIYKVNTQTGQTQALWSGQSQNIDATDLKVFNKTLFFTNRYNQELYGLVLSQ